MAMLMLIGVTIPVMLSVYGGFLHDIQIDGVGLAEVLGQLQATETQQAYITQLALHPF